MTKQRKKSKKKQQSTGTSVYDDVFRTLLNDCPRFIIPVINEAFHTHYPITQKIRLLNNELYTAGSNKKSRRKTNRRSTDAQIQFADLGNKLFHIECQSTPDGTMIVRMFEYDTAIAINKSRMENGRLIIDYPKSAVLYLREISDLPDTLDILIRTSEGELTHRIPVIKTQHYTIDEIFEKQLYFLIPFYLFHFEKEFESMEQNPQNLQKLTDTYTEILNQLNKLQETDQSISFLEKITIKDLSRAVARQLTHGDYPFVQEEVNNIMGGKILEYESKTAYTQGIKVGEKRGERRGEKRGEEKLRQLINALLLDGRNDDLQLALNDSKFLQQLYKEYKI
ncbi:MAG: hypothetical protein ACI4HI_05680 [Lachnospiraceae bacterium]